MPIFLLIAFLFFASTTSVSAEENGWILTQNSKVFGDQYVYISTQGVKCINPRQGIGWIAQGPQWNITFFNDKTKVYYPISYQQWKTKINNQGITAANLSGAKIGSDVIAGMKATQYKMTNATSSNVGKWQSADYWLSDDIRVPPSLGQLISSVCQLPASDLVPLKMSYRDKNNQPVNLLQTYRQQRASVPEQTFYLPHQYKLAKSEVEVLISQENRHLINELANDLNDRGEKSKDISSTASGLSLDKVPDQVTLPNGRTVSKDQINKFLNGLK
jgi:hypothetical protein